MLSVCSGKASKTLACCLEEPIDQGRSLRRYSQYDVQPGASKNNSRDLVRVLVLNGTYNVLATTTGINALLWNSSAALLKYSNALSIALPLERQPIKALTTWPTIGARCTAYSATFVAISSPRSLHISSIRRSCRSSSFQASLMSSFRCSLVPRIPRN